MFPAMRRHALAFVIVGLGLHLGATEIGAQALNAKPVQNYNVTGTVLQKLSEGLLIDCEPRKSAGNKKAEGVVLVINAPAQAQLAKGAKISLIARLVGDHQYTTILGAAETVPKFDASR